MIWRVATPIELVQTWTNVPVTSICCVNIIGYVNSEKVRLIWVVEPYYRCVRKRFRIPDRWPMRLCNYFPFKSPQFSSKPWTRVLARRSKLKPVPDVLFIDNLTKHIHLWPIVKSTDLRYMSHESSGPYYLAPVQLTALQLPMLVLVSCSAKRKGIRSIVGCGRVLIFRTSASATRADLTINNTN